MGETPKQAYERRRAERKAKAEQARADFERKDIETMDLMDRFVTAIERIADALESPSPDRGQQ